MRKKNNYGNGLMTFVRFQCSNAGIYWSDIVLWGPNVPRESKDADHVFQFPDKSQRKSEHDKNGERTGDNVLGASILALRAPSMGIMCGAYPRVAAHHNIRAM